MHYREAGSITLREAITRVAVRRAPDARVREHLKLPIPGAQTENLDLAPFRWETGALFDDPFLRQPRHPFVDAAAALDDARRELHQAFSVGRLAVHVRDDAGYLQTVGLNEWHTRVGVDLMHAGTSGGLPMRDMPAFVSEAPFAAWLQHRPISTLLPPDTGHLPADLTLVQACAWIVLRHRKAVSGIIDGMMEIDLLWSDYPSGPDVQGALVDLLLALRDGSLPARIKERAGTVPVPARRWRSMLLREQGKDVVGYEPLTAGPGQAEIIAPTVSTVSVLALWAPLDGAATLTDKASRAVQEKAFTGLVDKRWWGSEAPAEAWPFAKAAVIYSQDELHRLVEINNSTPGRRDVLPCPRDIYPPAVSEVWWDASDMHTPILVSRLLRGELRAFGDPAKGGTWPEWIASRAWRDLKRDPENERRFEGGGNVYWNVKVIPKEVVLDAAVPWAEACTAVASDLLPFPKEPYWLAWNAAVWRAFGTLNPPEHIYPNRSFDGGTSRLPDEPIADHAARLDEHRRFDAAEREVMDLLASSIVSATGKPPATARGEQLYAAARTAVSIPATTFINDRLAFTAMGELIDRLPYFERQFGNHNLHGSDADTRFPLYHEVLIEAAGLRAAWAGSARNKTSLEVAASASVLPLHLTAEAPVDRLYWTATEALTWLAFGKPETWEQVVQRHRRFEERWRFAPPAEAVLRLLEADGIAATNHPEPLADPSKDEAVPKHYDHCPYTAPSRRVEGPSGLIGLGAPRLAASIRTDHERRLGRPVTYAELATMLRAELDELRDRAGRWDVANKRLRNAIAREQAAAWGERENDPKHILVRLPASVAFRVIQFRADRIEPDDDTPVNDSESIITGEQWVQVRFKVEEVMALNVASTADGNATAAVSSPQPKVAATIASHKRLQVWLEAEMRASPTASPGKLVMRQRAKTAGQVFSDNGFIQAWAGAVAATGAVAWSNAGRKSKRLID